MTGLQAPPVVPQNHDLDFWIGTWKVYVEGKLDGTDVVEKVSGGFGVIEKWKGVEGGTGTSLFYWMPVKHQWKQVWVTAAGVYKEKFSEPFKGGIRFEGEIFLPDGRTISDRTTLTRLPKGKVRQVIEFSKDGHTWTVSYDAVYERA